MNPLRGLASVRGKESRIEDCVIIRSLDLAILRVRIYCECFVNIIPNGNLHRSQSAFGGEGLMSITYSIH